METHGSSSTKSGPVLRKNDLPQIWIGAFGAAAIVIGALLHWAGPVSGTQTNLRALWDPALVRDPNLVRTVGFAMIILGVVAAIGAISISPRITTLAGLLAIVGVFLFAISIMRGSGNVFDINIGPLVCLVGGLVAMSAGPLGKRLNQTT